MKNSNYFAKIIFFTLTLLLVCNSCVYKNIPRKINNTDRNGQKQGIWIESNFEDNEERIVLQFYKNNILDGDYREFFRDGNLGAKGKFRNGNPIGRWEYYLNNGTLISWRVYDKNGNVLEVGRINPIW